MEDFDLNEFAKMFDAALASDNPAVKKALRNFMMVTAIVHAQELDEAEREMGPIETLVKKVLELDKRVRQVESTKPYVGTGAPAYPSYPYGNGTIGNPTWVYNGTVTSTSSANSVTSVNSPINASSTAYDKAEIERIMSLLQSPSTQYLETLFETTDAK